MTAYLEALPPPRSGLPLEISFRRLLRSCEDIVSGDDKGRPDLKNFATSPVFHANLDYLQEQLADLSSIPNSNIDHELLDTYQRRVELLNQSLQPIILPTYCAKPLPNKADQQEMGMTLGATDSRPGKDGEGSRLRHRPMKPIVPLQQSAQERLNRHNNLQETLTEEMVALAAGLKKNAEAMKQAVARREGLLDQAEDAIEDSLVKAKKSSKESKSLRVKGSLTFCMILLSFVVVSLVFLGTYIFIKTTSFVGYRSRPR